MTHYTRKKAHTQHLQPRSLWKPSSETWSRSSDCDLFFLLPFFIRRTWTCREKPGTLAAWRLPGYYMVLYKFLGVGNWRYSQILSPAVKLLAFCGLHDLVVPRKSSKS